ncbi:hypothetical protein PUR29_13860 [Methylobacterium ajmalii]|uniref:Uncharacterized protein n=1 Tax=Methylobacterium ajmalii TaxID=2738439 RepID=A0ABU9ZTZ5_9HYPH
MLSFAAEFPVFYVGNHEKFVSAIKRWIVGSPHTDFTPDDFPDVAREDYWSNQKGNDKIEILIANDSGGNYYGARRIIFEPNIIWTTTIVMHEKDSVGWIGVRIYRESLQPSVNVPAAKRPVILRLLLEEFNGSADGELLVKRDPHRLTNDDIGLAARLMTGNADCYLPVVYISCNFRGGYDIDPNSTASDLAGIAHVVVEPNREFSSRLQIEANSYNVYGGSIGLYWPDSGTVRSIFKIKDYKIYKELKISIIDNIRNALVNRRPLRNCTWLAVEEIAIRQRINALKSSDSDKVQEYIDAIDKDLLLKDERIKEAENEINRLKREISRYQKTANRDGIVFAPGNEQNFFDGEINEIVYDALRGALDTVSPNGRRYHVIQSIIKNNPVTGILSIKREEVKNLLRNYKEMNSEMKRNFDRLGFTLTEEGKHYKAIYSYDNRYTFSIPKTPSDHRGSLNMVSDINKKLF